ncbi:sugar transferase [Lysinibacillus telephonicus]|uniref:sugar transferase n=1 Tax=Lysinibacillus telephonicus TaxID=1714840 RepID=UPI003BA27FAE
MKRLLDIIASLVALIFLLIPMIIIGLIIKLDSKGPILFKQQRVGRNKELFNIYKFRTMRTDTPNVSTEELGDPSIYITKVGKFLRKTSLDELPQLINILKGNMSIVGPRPALYNQYDLIAMREVFNVNSIRPGLTGYAQVRGRDFISDEEKVKFDEFYLKNQSLVLDLKIIMWTFITVIKSEGVRLQ